MRKYLIILTIIMFVSFILSSLFFFSSGFFNFETGSITKQETTPILAELDKLPFVNINQKHEVLGKEKNNSLINESP